MSTRLAQAIALAADVHAEQIDKGGEPYILHPIAVMQDVMRVTDRDELSGIVAVLHDAFEDNEKYGKDHLRSLVADISPDALPPLDVLTHDPQDDYLEVYIPAIIEFGAPCDVVKMADLRHNLDILRQPQLRQRDLLRLQRYHVSYQMLRDARS